MGRKKVNLEEKEDRISGLPDDIIRHILSFLPSTKQAIQTAILSKRWHKQWTHLPVLVFDSTGMSHLNFLKFVRNTLLLHECSKINKFHLQYSYPDNKDPKFAAKIRFAAKKNVEELHLISESEEYMLPKFLFNNASLVKLRTRNCSFNPNRKVNWGCLTGLNMKCCKLTDRAMELILSGTPLLKSLELSDCVEFDKLVIASKSLERLVLQNLNPYSNFRMSVIQISCPKLEELKLLGCLNVTTVKLLNLPSSVCATIDFYNYDRNTSYKIIESLIKDILHQLQHVKELIIGSWFIMILSTFEVGGQFSQVLNIKCLTLNDPDLYEYIYSGITCLLRNSPGLEKLVINLPQYYEEYDNCWENYWNSNANVFDCLVPHLKTIKIIIDFSKRDDKHVFRVVLNFVQFLLKNARVLEKMVIELKVNETAFPSELSQELLSLPRCSQFAVIEVICSNK